MIKINLTLNGKKKAYELENANIKNILDYEKIELKGIAIALNKVFVPKQKHSEINLKDNDEIEIVAPFQGG